MALVHGSKGTEFEPRLTSFFSSLENFLSFLVGYLPVLHLTEIFPRYSSYSGLLNASLVQIAIQSTS